MTFDHLQAISWSITYILLIIYGWKYKTHGIPLLAVILNYAWESIILGCSIIIGKLSPTLLVHIAWYVLDTGIVALFLFHESSFCRHLIKKIIFLISYILMMVFLAVLFWLSVMKFSWNDVELLAVFIIDLIMAVCFVIFVLRGKVKKGWLALAIGVTKLLGDMFAWLFYRDHTLVNIIGICVLVINIAYMIILLLKNFPRAGKVELQ